LVRNNIIEKVSIELLKKAAINLPLDVKNALRKAYENETSELGKSQLKIILDNIQEAENLERPVCQDTGIISYFIVGNTVNHQKIETILRNATAKATEKIPLRPNAVHPITRKNSGNNNGLYIPKITWIYEDVDYLEIIATLKGAGSENMTVLHMLPPGEGVKGLKRSILKAVVKSEGQPCPPTIINIGIGGTVDLTFKIAKLAMIRPLGKSHPENDIAELEKEILELVNATGIGPMGLGGKTTCLDVKIEYAHTHTACLPLGINFQCWCDRKAKARLYSDGSFKIVE
jgi:fumarate hydratase subunit alpha